MNRVEAKAIQSLFEKAKANDDVFFKKSLFHSVFLDTENVEELNSFHPKSVKLINLDDDYLCDIRADTFIIMTGFTETKNERDCVVVQGNHKGHLSFTAFYV